VTSYCSSWQSLDAALGWVIGRTRRIGVTLSKGRDADLIVMSGGEVEVGRGSVRYGKVRDGIAERSLGRGVWGW
jgi:hypothetical protein